MSRNSNTKRCIEGSALWQTDARDEPLNQRLLPTHISILFGLGMRILRAGDHGVVLGQSGIDLNVGQLVCGDIFVEENRLDGAFGDAGSAVNLMLIFIQTSQNVFSYGVVQGNH